MSVVGDTKGKTLPARAYTSPEVYEAEMREVFLKGWNFACHVSDVSEPGRFWTTSIAGEPIAVLRDSDGRLRALSNVCRHRASPASSPARAAARRCCAVPTTAGPTATTASWRRARGARLRQPRPRRREAAAVSGRRAVRAGVRVHERGDRAAGRATSATWPTRSGGCGWPSCRPAPGCRPPTTTTGR